MEIEKILMRDGGDGSVGVTLKFTDGPDLYLETTLPYDGGVIWERQPDGLKETVIDTYEEWEKIEDAN